MKQKLTAVLLCAVLAGCADTAPVKIDTRAISEMPVDVALSYLQNWKAPAGLITVPMDASEKCGAIGNTAMTLRKGQSFPYGRLTLDVTTAGSRYRSVNLTVAESTWTWCRFGNFGWDTENADINRRALAEINRIGTAFSALGAKIERP